MGFHGVANAELVLELGLNSSSMAENTTRPTKKPDLSSDSLLEPSLTLALSGDLCGGFDGGQSLSNASVKREREVASEESEKGVAINTRGDDGEDDEDGSVNGRKKLRLTKAQSGQLEEAFKLHTTLNPQHKLKLARDLKLRPRQVEVWFQNRRARTKLKQTEVDCEYLKKCCSRLTDENQRLRQEVQELKTQKMTQPIYMQLPAATLTMCPSCEQIGETNPASTNTPFTMATKRQLFSLFSSSSAAY